MFPQLSVKVSRAIRGCSSLGVFSAASTRREGCGAPRSLQSQPIILNNASSVKQSIKVCNLGDGVLPYNELMGSQRPRSFVHNRDSELKETSESWPEVRDALMMKKIKCFLFNHYVNNLSAPLTP